MFRTVCCFVLLATIVVESQAQLATGWRAHDFDRPTPRVVQPGEAMLPVPPPGDATVLFDGSDLSAWRNEDGDDAGWRIVDGAMESVAGSGYVFTRQAFGDCQLHIEWASPAKPKGKSQGRGNSGVFLMGKYEVQVLDSYDNRTYADGQAGSIYGQYPPLVNVSRKPGEWQSYDIIFRRPRFGVDKRLLRPAKITVLHNGVVVQDGTEPFGPTSWMQHNLYAAHAPKLPLSLQDHGNPVRYRNIWIRPLNENPRPHPTQPYESTAVNLTDDEMNAVVGRFGQFNVIKEDGILCVKVGGRPLEMIPVAKNEFHLRYTAAKLIFTKGEDGKAVSLAFDMGGDIRQAIRDMPKKEKSQVTEEDQVAKQSEDETED